MKFSFVVLTWNRKAFLEKCLASLAESIGTFDETEVIVMDNGSTDGTAAVLAAYEGRKGFRVIRLDRNYGLNSYKKLFNKAKGKYIVVVDDDVLTFPKNLKAVFESYMNAFPDYGFLALDVIQNEYTNGAKPTADFYVETERAGKIVQTGPAGGWCACFRKWDYRKVMIPFNLKQLNMKSSEDGQLVGLFAKWLKLKSGIIKGHYCFHASGPHYSSEYGYLDRDIEKYKDAGLDWFVEKYEEYK